jgi:hypothetical protein
MLGINENIPCQDYAKAAFAPSFVEVDELMRRDPTGFDIDGIP